MNRLRYVWEWVWHGRQRCEAIAVNFEGKDVSDNPYSMVFTTYGARCHGRAVACTETFWGTCRLNICERHAMAALTLNR